MLYSPVLGRMDLPDATFLPKIRVHQYHRAPPCRRGGDIGKRSGIGAGQYVDEAWVTTDQLAKDGYQMFRTRRALTLQAQNTGTQPGKAGGETGSARARNLPTHVSRARRLWRQRKNSTDRGE